MLCCFPCCFFLYRSNSVDSNLLRTFFFCFHFIYIFWWILKYFGILSVDPVKLTHRKLQSRRFLSSTRAVKIFYGISSWCAISSKLKAQIHESLFCIVLFVSHTVLWFLHCVSLSFYATSSVTTWPCASFIHSLPVSQATMPNPSL